MIGIGNIVAYFTNPATSMLLGFDLQENILYNDLQEEMGHAYIFSIGIGIARLDWFFDLTQYEE